MVDLRQQTNHVRMDHRGVQVCVQRRVAETFLQAITVTIRAFRVHFALCDLPLIRDVVTERLHVLVDKPDLEHDDDENGR